MATAGAADSGTYLPTVDRATVQGPIMRWSQNEWKDNWMVLDIATKTLTVHRSEDHHKNKHTPRVCIDAHGAEISVDQQSIRRFTIDDGAMMIYFRTNDQAARDAWLKCFKDVLKEDEEKKEDTRLRRRAKSKNLNTVGDYMLGDLVGEGGYAKVKSGFHVKTGARIAAKILTGPLSAEVKREIMTMSALKHKNVIELKDVVDSKGTLYLIMELARGGELFAKLCEIRYFPEDSARFYWKQLMEGTLYCHKKGLCHRDLKLENLLLDEKGEVLKITDFGFAKFQMDSMPKTILGTAVYVAPEVLENQAYDGYKADVWSCGVILYTMIVGNYPFDMGYHGGVGKGNKRNVAIYDMLMKAEYRVPSRATAELRDLFAHIFQPNPALRFDIEGCMKHPWSRGKESVAEVDSLISKMTKDMIADDAISKKVGSMAAAKDGGALAGAVEAMDELSVSDRLELSGHGDGLDDDDALEM